MIKHALKLFGKLVICNIMNIIVIISFVAIFSIAFTHSVGQTVAVYDNDGNLQQDLTYTYYTDEEYYNQNKDNANTYYFESGSDEKAAELADEGYTTSASSIRSEPTTSASNWSYIIIALFTLFLTLSFCYAPLWDIGAKDSNAVHFGRKKEDRLYGLKVGLLARIPAVILYILALCLARGITPSLFGMICAENYGIIQLMTGNVTRLCDMSAITIIVCFILLLIVPIATGIGYYLGYKDISLGEKMIYKKEKK